MTTQDPELSAALGWPGGTGDPVLDRTRLLQMVAALRLTSKQALEALEYRDGDGADQWKADVITALRAALAQEQTEPDISRCPQCNGPADNGFDRSFPPSPYLCTKCMAEPVAALTAQRDVLLEALKYHQEQTRPIQWTLDVIKAVEEWK